MQWHQARLAELGTADRQHRRRQIDILKLEIAGFAKAQARVMDQVMALPFGSLTKMQAVRANVQNFRPYRIPRMSNVWFAD